MRSDVKAVVDEAEERKKGKLPDEHRKELPGTSGSEVKSKEVQGTSGTTSGTSGSGSGVLVVNDIDASIYEKKPPQVISPPSSPSPTSPPSPSSSGTSLGTSPGTSPEQKPPVNDSENQIVMYLYRFMDGRVMYYPTRLADIEEQE